MVTVFQAVASVLFGVPERIPSVSRDRQVSATLGGSDRALPSLRAFRHPDNVKTSPAMGQDV
jgi:hypothetical protein